MDKIQLLLFYLSSIVMAKYTHFEAVLDVLKDLADNGYKFKSNKEVSFSNVNGYDDYIPIWNIVKALYDYCNYQFNKGTILDYLFIEGDLEKLTPWEEREYKKCPSKWHISHVLNEYERRINKCYVVQIPEEKYGVNPVFSNVYFYITKDGQFDILKADGPFSSKPLEEQREAVRNLYWAVEMIEHDNEVLEMLFQAVALEEKEMAQIESELKDLEESGFDFEGENNFTPEETEKLNKEAEAIMQNILKDLLEEAKRRNDGPKLTKKKDEK